jgi:anti-sigma regulatory factor (Ser/Thr protein kinase)
MTLRLVLRNALPEVERMAESILAWGRDAGLSEAFVGELRLVLEELTENAIRYGYPSGVNGHIEVRLALTATDVTAEVENDGVAFDPLAQAPPDLTIPAQDRPIGGLGIFLVRQLTNGITYGRTSGTNLVSFSMSVPPASTTPEKARG